MQINKFAQASEAAWPDKMDAVIEALLVTSLLSITTAPTKMSPDYEPGLVD